jgi:hypothetical protein
VSDRHTTDFVSLDAGDPDASDICIPIDAGIQATITDPTTGIVVGSVGAVNPRACGNIFYRTLFLTSDWRLYLLPFSTFHQKPAPSRRVDGLDTSGIFNLTIRPVKEAVAEFWIAHLSWYKHASGAAADAGSDAAPDVGSRPPPPVDTGVDSPGSDTGADAEPDAGITDASAE